MLRHGFFGRKHSAALLARIPGVTADDFDGYKVADPSNDGDED